MNSYGEDLFELAVDPELWCPICWGVLDCPVYSMLCMHVFCRSCITSWLQHNQSCPVCQAGLTSSTLQPVLPIIQSMINNLLMKCPNAKRGCPRGIKLKSYKHHLGKCMYREEQCNVCKRLHLVKDRTQHLVACIRHTVQLSMLHSKLRRTYETLQSTHIFVGMWAE